MSFHKSKNLILSRLARAKLPSASSASYTAVSVAVAKKCEIRVDLSGPW